MRPPSELAEGTPRRKRDPLRAPQLAPAASYAYSALAPGCGLRSHPHELPLALLLCATALTKPEAEGFAASIPMRRLLSHATSSACVREAVGCCAAQGPAACDPPCTRDGGTLACSQSLTPPCGKGSDSSTVLTPSLPHCTVRRRSIASSYRWLRTVTQPTASS